MRGSLFIVMDLASNFGLFGQLAPKWGLENPHCL